MKRLGRRVDQVGILLHCDRLVSCAMAIVLLGSLANAAVFERDWKAPGDGLLTFDDVNRREWLDLSQTLLSDQFPSSGASAGEIRESRYQFVVSKTAPGGLFEGFTVAKSNDVVLLAQSAGIDTSTQDYLTNAPATSLLTSLLSYTVTPPNGNKLSVGLLDEIFELIPFRRASADFLFLEGFVTQAGLQLGSGHFQYSTPPGVYLYRSVPEPATVSLAVIAVVLPLRIRRGKPGLTTNDAKSAVYGMSQRLLSPRPA